MRVSIRRRKSAAYFETELLTDERSQRPKRATAAPKCSQRSSSQSVLIPISPARPSSRMSSKSSTTRSRLASRPKSSHDPAVTEVSCSPFLRLPPEVRVCIYRYLLPPSLDKFKVYTDCNSTYTDRKWDVQRRASYRLGQPNSLALLRINRIIYYEALSVLYSENTFHFIGCNFLPIIDFIRKLSPDAKALVRQLKITMLPEARHLRADQLELFCRVVHEWLPGLNVLASDAWVWI